MTAVRERGPAGLLVERSGALSSEGAKQLKQPASGLFPVVGWAVAVNSA